jgi:hypothetical protein
MGANDARLSGQRAVGAKLCLIKFKTHSAFSRGVWMEGVEVYSTLLVVFPHTFTGKFLCGRNIGRDHPFCKDVSAFKCDFDPR